MIKSYKPYPKVVLELITAVFMLSAFSITSSSITWAQNVGAIITVPVEFKNLPAPNGVESFHVLCSCNDASGSLVASGGTIVTDQETNKIPISGGTRTGRMNLRINCEFSGSGKSSDIVSYECYFSRLQVLKKGVGRVPFFGAKLNTPNWSTTLSDVLSRQSSTLNTGQQTNWDGPATTARPVGPPGVRP